MFAETGGGKKLATCVSKKTTSNLGHSFGEGQR